MWNNLRFTDVLRKMGQDGIRALHDRWIIALFNKVVHRLFDLSSLEIPRNLHRRFNERLRKVPVRRAECPQARSTPEIRACAASISCVLAPWLSKIGSYSSSSTGISGAAKSSFCIRWGVPKVVSASSPNTDP